MHPLRCLAVFALSASAFAENIVFPPDAVCDVTKPPYSAKGDGLSDDTAAIQKALDERQNLIYLPNGIYIVSNTLRWGPNQKRQVLQGQSVDGTTIKLQDNCPGFSIPERPLAVVWTGKAPAQRFRNGLRNLTIDTGKGNAGAIGAQFIANNQGTIDTVHIRCGESGPIGLDLAYANEQGPCLLTHLHVTGFDVGIATKGPVNSITAEDIALEGQKSAGWKNDGQPVFVRNLRSTGTASAFVNAGRDGVVTLLDSTLTGGDAAKGVAAIVNAGAMFVRGLKTSGFRTAVQNDGGTKQSPAGVAIDEWVSHPPVHAWDDAPARSLGLLVKETPDVPWDDPADWISVVQFGAKKVVPPGSRPRARGVPDWTDAIQAAIDSGKSTIYFPKDGCEFVGVVHVRGKARRFIGCEQAFGKKSTGTWEIEAGDSPVVVFERFDWTASPVNTHVNTSRTVVVKNTSGGSYAIDHNAGDVFFSDVSTGKLRIDSAHVWARQLNTEGSEEAKTINDSGTLWVLGLKTEGDSTQVVSQNGARTEIAGAFIYATSGRPKQPCFTVTDSAFSLLGFAEAATRRRPFLDLVVETRRGETKALRSGETPSRTGGALILQYSGFSGK